MKTRFRFVLRTSAFILVLAVTTAEVFLFPNAAYAQATNSWTDGNGKWENSNNWSRVLAPSTNDSANLVTNAGNNTVTIDATTAGSFPATMTISNLTVSAPSGSTNTLFLNNAGTATPFSVLNLLVSESNSIMAVNHSVLQSAGNLFVGNTGAVNQLVITNGGAVYNATGYVGYNIPSSNNVVTVAGTGSVWSNGIDLYVGYSGAGNSLLITNGGVVYNGNSEVGLLGARNAVLVADAGSVWSNQYNLLVGMSGAGNTLTIINGGVVFDDSGVVGNASSSSNNVVTVTGSGSVWSNRLDLYVGSPGPGNQMTITNGGAVYNATGYVGYFSPGSNNVVTVTGSGSVWRNSVALIVGYAEPGNTLTITNAGTVLVSSNLLIGASANAVGIVNLSDGGTLYVTNVAHDAVTEVRRGTLTLNTGGVFVTDSLVISNAGGSFVNNGGTFTITGQAQFDQGTQTFAGGTTVLSSNLLVGSSANATSTVNVTGGSLVVTNAPLSLGNSGTSTNGTGVGLLAVSTATVEAVTILIGSSAGGKGDLIVGAGGIVSCPAGTNGLMEINSLGTEVDEGGDLLWNNSTLECGVIAPGDYIVSGGLSTIEDLYIGYSDTGTMTMAGGVVDVTSRLIVGHLGTPLATGAIWMNGGELTVLNNYTIIGNSGVGQMTISNGTVTATDVFVANSSNLGTLTAAGGAMTVLSSLTVGDCNPGHVGVVAIVGGNLFVTNAAHTATLDVRSGTLTLSSGLLQVDKIVITNACAHFARTGGVLSHGSVVLDPIRDDDGDGIPNDYEQAHGLDPLNAADANLDNDGDGFTNLQEFQAGTDPNDNASAFRITAIARVANTNILVTWTMGPGKTNALQRTAGTASGSYSNNFADIYTITNTVGTTTNYLDVGAASAGTTSRFYRVRLVP